MLHIRRKKLPRRYDNFYLAWVEDRQSLFYYYLCVIFYDKQYTPTHYIPLFNTSSFFIPRDITPRLRQRLRGNIDNIAYSANNSQEITPWKFNKRILRVVRYLSVREYVKLLPLRRKLITTIKDICVR